MDVTLAGRKEERCAVGNWGSLGQDLDATFMKKITSVRSAGGRKETATSAEGQDQEDCPRAGSAATTRLQSTAGRKRSHNSGTTCRVTRFFSPPFCLCLGFGWCATAPRGKAATPMCSLKNSGCLVPLRSIAAPQFHRSLFQRCLFNYLARLREEPDSNEGVPLKHSGF